MSPGKAYKARESYYVESLEHPESILAVLREVVECENRPALMSAVESLYRNIFSLPNPSKNMRVIADLKKAAEEGDWLVLRAIIDALEVNILGEKSSSSQKPDKKHVLQHFFKKAAQNNNVEALSKLIQENIEEVGELCESLKENLFSAILPKIANTLLTWGVTNNKYELIEKFIDREGKKYTTNTSSDCLGQRVTEIAAQKGCQRLFMLLIENEVDVDTRGITAFMSAVICEEYKLAHTMIELGEYRLEQPEKSGYTPQDYLRRRQFVSSIFEEEKTQKEKKL